VPALAISFSLAKGLGFSRTLKELLINEFTASQADVIQRIIGYVENTKVGTLGVVGVAMLVITLVLTLSSVEETFNRIWNVRLARSWARKFADYLSVLIIVPLLVVAATGVWAGLTSHGLVQWVLQIAVVGDLAATGMRLGPYLMLTAAFVFLYFFLPNTSIPFGSAVVAGLVASLLWWGVQSAYVQFQLGVARYNAIYGGFASLPLFMVWLHVSWTVLLFGAQLCHAHHVCRRGPLPRGVLPPLNQAQREATALRLLYRLSRRFDQGRPPEALYPLARELWVPMADLAGIVAKLADAGLVSVAGSDNQIQPGRSLDSMPLSQILEALRGTYPRVGRTEGGRECLDDAGLLDVLGLAEDRAREALSLTMLDLVKSCRAVDAGPQPRPPEKTPDA
jgi:membrane protein